MILIRHEDKERIPSIENNHYNRLRNCAKENKIVKLSEMKELIIRSALSEKAKHDILHDHRKHFKGCDNPAIFGAGQSVRALHWLGISMIPGNIGGARSISILLRGVECQIIATPKDRAVIAVILDLYKDGFSRGRFQFQYFMIETCMFNLSSHRLIIGTHINHRRRSMKRDNRGMTA